MVGNVGLSHSHSLRSHLQNTSTATPASDTASSCGHDSLAYYPELRHAVENLKYSTGWDENTATLLKMVAGKLHSSQEIDDRLLEKLAIFDGHAHHQDAPEDLKALFRQIAAELERDPGQYQALLQSDSIDKVVTSSLTQDSHSAAARMLSNMGWNVLNKVVEKLVIELIPVHELRSFNENYEELRSIYLGNYTPQGRLEALSCALERLSKKLTTCGDHAQQYPQVKAAMQMLKSSVDTVAPWLKTVSHQWQTLEHNIHELRDNESALGKVVGLLAMTETMLSDLQSKAIIDKDRLDSIGHGLSAMRQTLGQIQMWQALPGDVGLTGYLKILSDNPLVQSVLEESTLRLATVLANVREGYPSNGSLAVRMAWLSGTLANPELRERLQPHLEMVLGGKSQADQLFATFQLAGQMRFFPTDSSLGGQALWLLTLLSQNSGDTPGLEWVKHFQSALGADPATLMLLNRLLNLNQSPDSWGGLMRDLAKEAAPSVGLMMARNAADQLLPLEVSQQLEKFYLGSSKTESWGDMCKRLANCVGEIAKPYLIGGLMGDPLSTATVRYAEALQKHTSFDETLRWFVANDPSQDRMLQFAYSQYLNAMLVWQVYQAFNSKSQEETEDTLRLLAGRLKDYQVVKSYPQLEKLIDLIPLLPALKEARQTLGTLPPADTWLGWSNQWLDTLANSNSKSLLELREQLSRKVENWLADAAMSACDTVVQQSWGLLPEAAAAPVSDATPATTSGHRTHWQLGAGISLEAIGLGAIGYALWHMRQTASAAPSGQDIEMQPMALSRENPAAPADENPLLRSPETVPTVVPSSGWSSLLDQKIPLLLGVMAMTAGSAFLYRWANSGVDATSPQNDSDYQKAMEILKTLDVPDLSFLFYDELGEGNAASLASKTAAAEKAQPDAENRGKRSLAETSDTIPQRIEALRQNRQITPAHIAYLLSMSVDNAVEVKEAISDGMPQAHLNVLKLLKAIEYLTNYQDRSPREARFTAPVLAGLWQIADGLTDEYGQSKVREYRAAFLISRSTQPSSATTATTGTLATMTTEPRITSDDIPQFIAKAFDEARLKGSPILLSILLTIQSKVENSATVKTAQEGAVKNVELLLGYLNTLPAELKHFTSETAAKIQILWDKLSDVADALSDDYGRSRVDAWRRPVGRTSPVLSVTTAVVETTGSPTTAAPSLAEKLTDSTESTCQKLEDLDSMILSPSAFIDDYITKEIAAYEKRTGEKTRMNPDSVVTVVCSPAGYDANLLPYNKSAPSKLRMSATLRDVVSGQYLYKFREQKDSLDRTYPYPFITFEPEGLISALTANNLQTRMEQALQTYRETPANKTGMTSLYKEMITLRCLAYLEDSNHAPAYKLAVENFLQGRVQAQEVFFKGTRLNGAFLIPVGESRGVLFSVDEAECFDVGNSTITYDPSELRRGIQVNVPKFPNTPEFKNWVLNKMPGYNAQEYRNRPATMFNSAVLTHSQMNFPRTQRIDRPVSFSEGVSTDVLADKLFDGLMDRLNSDIDYQVFSSYEQNLDHALEVGKAILMLATTALNVAVPGTGTLLSRVGVFLANMALDAAYVTAAATQSYLADRPQDAAAFRNEAIIAGVLGGVGTTIGGAALSREGIAAARNLYRQARFASGNIIPAALGKVAWTKLADPKKIDLLVDAVEKSTNAVQLKTLIPPTVVTQSIRRNLALDFEGAAKTRFAWGDFPIEQLQAERRLNSDLARLNDAQQHMRQLLASPPTLPRVFIPGERVEQAANWIARNSRSATATDSLSELEQRIKGVLSDNRNRQADLLDIATIDRIHGEVYQPASGQTARTFRSSSDPTFMGSDVARAGFEKALADIRRSNPTEVGDMLFAAIARYHPYGDGNGRTARTLYALAKLKQEGTHFEALGVEAENLLNPSGPLRQPVVPSSALEHSDLGVPLTSAQEAQLKTERARYLTNAEQMKTRSSADFERGKSNPASLDSVQGVNDEMSELELTLVYNDSSRKLSAEQRGALSGLIEEARRKRLIENSLAVAAKYSQILGEGSTRTMIAPQTFLLSAAGASEAGRCSPMVLSLAVALKNDHVEALMTNFYRAAAHTEEPNRRIIRALDVLHGTSIQSHLSPATFTSSSEGGTIREIVQKVNGEAGTSLFSMDSKGHAMLVGTTVNPQGSQIFHFYDPNIGLFNYPSARELKTALQKTVGTRAMGEQYAAFGSLDSPRYKLSKINTDTLGEMQLQVPGAQTVTVRSLSEETVAAVNCDAGGRSRRNPLCGLIEADIAQLEQILEATYSGRSPGPGSFDFAINYVDTLTARNTTHAMGLDKDLQTLAKAKAEVEQFRTQLRADARNQNLQVQCRTAYSNYLTALIDTTQKSRVKMSVIENVRDAIANALNTETPRTAGASNRPGDTITDTRTIMRYMTRTEADELIRTRKFSQGPQSFEQHKWFFTDKTAYNPKGGTGFDCELKVTVPRDTIPKIFDIADSDPQGTTAPVRYKPGGEASLEQEEKGAFGIQKYGLEAFSRILETPANWDIRDLKAGRNLPK